MTIKITILNMYKRLLTWKKKLNFEEIIPLKNNKIIVYIK